MTYVERLCKILKDLDILDKEQRKYRNEILEVLEREDAAIAEVKEAAV